MSLQVDYNGVQINGFLSLSLSLRWFDTVGCSGGSRIYKRGKDEAPKVPRLSSIGARIEAPRGVGRVSPSPMGRGDAPPRIFFSIFDLKMATLGAFWTLFLQFSYLI